ncbi:MAG: 4-(cytidine 5'-diphospho)-2-C-methyl-D-erythritol kinase [Eubacterium sp.]|nr:4-(cytidine 5'-diphospho)-2-C-methyl-D-erythritol kinase [Eubacterium sp.]
MLEVKAYAKVNLSLDIVGRREDGYHLVRMVMQSLDIADILTFEKLDKPEIIVLLDNPSVGSDGDSPLGKVPLDENNLIYKAARLLFDRYIWKRNEKAGVQITLTKNIPIAAGMAGGSSDAAATFRGINELFELGLMDKELMEMGVTLGADIPYCIMGGTALSEGIGEELTRLPDIPECVFLVVKPRISVSTAEAYGGYDSLVESKTGQKVRIIHPDVDGQVDALYAGNLKGVTDKFLNVLEYVTAEKHPIIGDIEKIMLDFGALNAMMSGSGPTVFGIFEDVEKAEAAKKELEQRDISDQLFVVSSLQYKG